MKKGINIMKDGSIDIPAIKFCVVVGKDIELDSFTACLDKISSKIFDIRVYDFDSVDGLTFEQLYELFCLTDDYNVIVSAYIDRTNKLDNVRNQNFKCAITFKGKEHQNCNLEISSAYEEALTYALVKDGKCPNIALTSGITIEQVTKTFCSRYRGKSEKEIDSNVRCRKAFHI